MPHKPDVKTSGVTQLVSPVQAAELERQIAAHTDTYFKKTKEIVARTGDKTVTYAVFMRRPVIFCPRLMVEWIEKVAAASVEPTTAPSSSAVRRSTSSAR